MSHTSTLSAALDEAHVYVTFQQAHDGRWVAARIVIEGEPWISATTLRAVPLARLEAKANMPAVIDVGPVKRPTSYRLPDEFYATVGARYASLATSSTSPTKDLADEFGVKYETACRWLKVARRRGHLAPGRKGRAG